MIEMNLLPEELRRKEVSKIVMPDLPVKKICLVAIPVIIAIHLLLVLSTAGISLRVKALKSEVVDLKKKTEGILYHKAEIAKIRTKLSEAETQLQRPFYWTPLLNAVSDSIIKGIWLNSLYIESETVVRPAPSKIKSAVKGKKREVRDSVPVSVKVLKLSGGVVGQGDETANVGKFIKELKSNAVLSALFSEINLSDMTQKKVKDMDLYEFMVTCHFKSSKSERKTVSK